MISKSTKFTAACALLQAVFIALFGIYTEFDDQAQVLLPHRTPVRTPDQIDTVYPMFGDVHVMVFVGIAFLLTFLSRYGFSAVGLNLVIASFCVQWHILFNGLINMKDNKIQIGITNLLDGDIGAATVLISFCVVLGKVSPLQMLIVSLVEIMGYCANTYVSDAVLKVVDPGDSMLVHMFAAYFGLAVAWIIKKPEQQTSKKLTSNYQSDLFSMIGTLFLWCYWPSFNACESVGAEKHRAVINTYLSLASCTLTTFAVSTVVTPERKFSMAHVQNSTLAGGVAMGAVGTMIISPVYAVVVGVAGGLSSVIGFQFITPWMSSKLNVHDTCGVHSLHAIPGFVAAFASIIIASMASFKNYGYSLYTVFPARVPLDNTTALHEIQKYVTVDAGSDWSAGHQASMQVATMFVTIAISIGSGLLAGLLIRLPGLDQPEGSSLYDDNEFWEVPEKEATNSEKFTLNANNGQKVGAYNSLE